ncbi:hypothetical protein B0H19DRAFT_1117441 [Mycena capillaripes]|nr:hypothetical protein B0H19DRAFT_1117441 [Mycena capillaripes]
MDTLLPLPGRVSALLDSNEAPSESEARSIHDLLSTARAEKARFNDAEITTAGHISTGNAQLDTLILKCGAALSPLRQIPTEILSLIFTFAIVLPRGTPSRQVALWSISQVCRLWRAILLSRPSLWATVNLDLLLRPDESCFRLETQLERSGQLPLRVTLNYVPRATARRKQLMNIRKLINTVVEHCGRWEKLEISFPMDGDHWFLDCIRGQLPSLRELSIKLYAYLHDVEDDREENIHSRDGYSCEYFEHAPSLREVSVIWDKFPAQVRLPFPQLLQYRGTDTWDGHVMNLRSASNLVDCALNLKGAISIPETRLSLPHLHRLAVTTSKFLDCLDAPALRELHCSGPTGHIASFLQAQRLPCELQKLFIHNCRKSSAPDFGSLLYATPTLAHLGVQFTDLDLCKDLYSLLTLSTSTTELKTLSVCLPRYLPAGCNCCIDVDCRFVDMLESRWRSGALHSVSYSGIVSMECLNRMAHLRDQGLKLKVTVNRKASTLLLDMTPDHLRLNYIM